MARTARISVEVLGDSRSVERMFKRTAQSAQRFELSIAGVGRSIAKTAGAVGLVFGGAELARGIGGAIQAASDLTEQMNRTTVVFGDSADSIEAWSKTTAEGFGIAQREALAAAGNFGTMFKTTGLAAGQAALMSRRLVELAADMASFNNQDPSDMLDRLRSGLAGEAEPLRRFGVLLSEARVQQEAFRSGLARQGSKLTEQQKVLARYSLILKDTTVQQGDFARTSGSLANQMRVLNAEWDEAQATLGKALVPIVSRLIHDFNEWTQDIAAIAEVIERQFLRAITRMVGYLEKLAAAAAHLPRRLGGGWADDMQEALQDMQRGLDHAARSVGYSVGEQTAKGFQAALSEHLALMRPRTGADVGGAAAPAFRPTAEQRNQWFDAGVARQLDRLQDLTLRKQLEGLKATARQIRDRLAITKDATRRLTLEDQLLDVYRRQRSVQEQITGAIEAGNQALKDRADAIKSAIIERLQRRQTDILNRRALQDAREQLRIARQIGGPRGIQEAVRAMQDVRFDILRAQAEAAPAGIRGGRFALGGITVNINGITDPDQVARKVVQVLQKRDRHVTSQTRGPTAGSTGGAR